MDELIKLPNRLIQNGPVIFVSEIVDRIYGLPTDIGADIDVYVIDGDIDWVVSTDDEDDIDTTEHENLFESVFQTYMSDLEYSWNKLKTK